MLTVGSLFAGIGGIELGLEMTGGFQTVWQVENDEYATRVLAKHWPDVRRWGDVRTFPPKCADWGCDIICGGFPCKDISSLNAHKRGLDGDQSGLWREFLRIVGYLRPRYVIVENVATMLVRGLSEVLGDFTQIRYDAEWHCIPAAHFGAPIQAEGRDRVWIVAEPNGGRFRGPWLSWETGGQLLACPAGGDSYVVGIPGAASDYWQSEPSISRVSDGVPNRSHRIRCLGNAVVPQVAYWIGQRILAAERELEARDQT